jgi:ubiquinone/menaquinone biosynthesis C-methylase UbiE
MSSAVDEGQVEYWRDVADRPWGSYIVDAQERQLRRLLARHTGVRRALDVGCGGGRWSALLADDGWDVTGLDVSVTAVARCAQRIPEGHFFCVDTDAPALPVGDQTVDLIVCIEVRPVVESPWFLPEARRVLRPGGQLFVVVWNSRSLRGAVANALRLLRDHRRHPFYSTAYVSWRKQLGDAGFRITEQQGLCWMPLSRASKSRLAPALARLEKGLRLGRLASLSPWVIVSAERTGQ